jgi:hypothetical protein
MRLWPQPQNKYCEINGKRAYDKRGAQTKVNSSHNHGVILRYYQCPFCGFFHLTHQKKL